MQAENEQVKPDVVAVSNKQLHALVFDCKSGKNAEADQVARYKKLTDEDLLRWVGDKVYATKGVPTTPAMCAWKSIGRSCHRT